MISTEHNELIAKILPLIRQLSASIDAQVIVAGGAVRDMIHGKTPKDFDLCVLMDADGDSYSELSEFVEAALEKIEGVTVNEVCDSYRDGTDLKLAYVIKFTFEGLEFDLIQYVNSNATDNPRTQVSHFDCNLNMVWLDAEGNIRVEPEALAVLMGKTPVTALNSLDGDRASRLAYIGSKFPQYGVDPTNVITPEVY